MGNGKESKMAGIGQANEGALYRAFREVAGLVGLNCNVSVDQRRFLLGGIECALQRARGEASQSMDETLMSCIDVVRREKERLSDSDRPEQAEGFRVGLVI